MKYIYDLLQTCIVREAVSYQAGSLLMSSRLGRPRLYSADCVGPIHKECQGSLSASDCNHKQSVIHAGQKYILLTRATKELLTYNRLNVTLIT